MQPKYMLYSHYDQTIEWFDDKVEAIEAYREWRDNFKKDLREAKEETGDYNGDEQLCTEMIILSRVIHGIEFDEEKRGGYNIIK